MSFTYDAEGNKRTSLEMLRTLLLKGFNVVEKCSGDGVAYKYFAKRSAKYSNFRPITELKLLR